ncbi:Knot1 domain-containing protein [Caenorhabditis elegans]|uniref:Knot1 domain-containing protein n=1 Tax=Caenorhabditis elegans TaxID=6239 RepID=A5Z2S1_CAEEL|nr:Knot1 domain-containing protein [Caenorhabditis elegans]CAN99724.1 Knot1 domain-containing protein [Caenorhabditis elegans]|eukprot:NP_001122641.1 Uncharacterized protein CELE_T19H5.7 [Caenorhabditis elegans]
MSKANLYSSLFLLLLIFSLVAAKIDITDDGWGWCTNKKCDEKCQMAKYNFGTCEFYLLIRSRCLCVNI